MIIVIVEKDIFIEGIEWFLNIRSIFVGMGLIGIFDHLVFLTLSFIAGIDLVKIRCFGLVEKFLFCILRFVCLVRRCSLLAMFSIRFFFALSPIVSKAIMSATISSL